MHFVYLGGIQTSIFALTEVYRYMPVWEVYNQYEILVYRASSQSQYRESVQGVCSRYMNGVNIEPKSMRPLCRHKDGVEIWYRDMV